MVVFVMVSVVDSVWMLAAAPPAPPYSMVVCCRVEGCPLLDG